MPLQVGITAANALLGALLFLAATLSLLVLGVFLDARVDPLWAWSLTMVGVWPPLGGLACLILMRRTAPTDVVLSSQGIEIDRSGGRVRLSWEAMRGGEATVFGLWEWQLDPIARLRGAPATEVDRLALTLADGTQLAVADATNALERESLRAVHDTLQAAGVRGDGPPPGAPPTAGRFALLRCAGCGAPVAPQRAETTRCTHCGTDVSVPASMRDRVAAIESEINSRRTTEDLVRRLLKQPAARVTRYLLRLGGLLCALLWVGGAALLIWQIITARTSILAVVAVVVACGGSSALLYALASRRLLRRSALRLFAIRFGALPPDRAGSPPRCRRCAGPLPEATHVLVRCVYCDADNLPAIGFHHRARGPEPSRDELDREARRRWSARRRWGRSAAIAAAGTAVGLALTAATAVP